MVIHNNIIQIVFNPNCSLNLLKRVFPNSNPNLISTKRIIYKDNYQVHHSNITKRDSLFNNKNHRLLNQPQITIITIIITIIITTTITILIEYKLSLNSQLEVRSRRKYHKSQ